MFVTGGFSNGTLNTVLKFCLQTCTFDDSIASMQYKRENHSSSVAGDKLYVFGGDTPLSLDPCIEVLNLSSQESAWKSVTTQLL